MKSKILTVLTAAAILPLMLAMAADRPYEIERVIPATNLVYSFTNAYVAGSAADNLVAMVPTWVAIKFTGECHTNPTVLFSRVSGTNSYQFLSVACPSNTLQVVTNMPGLVFRTSDILKIQVTPQHTNITQVEVHYQ